MSGNPRPPFPFPLLKFWFLRVFPAWAGIASIIFMMQIAVAAIVHDNDNVRIFLNFIDLLPDFVKAALGGDLLKSGELQGLLTIGYQHPFMMFLNMVYAVGVPTGLLTAEVQKGTMELVLSRSVSKTHVYICAAVLTIVGMFGLEIVMFLGTVASVNIYTFTEPINLWLFARIAVTGGLLASTFGAFALLSAALFGQFYMALGASVAFLSLNYFISIVSQWWPALKFLRYATLFSLVFYSRVWFEWPWQNLAILGGIMLAAVIAGGLIWRRRDLFA